MSCGHVSSFRFLTLALVASSIVNPRHAAAEEGQGSGAEPRITVSDPSASHPDLVLPTFWAVVSAIAAAGSIAVLVTGINEINESNRIEIAYSRTVARDHGKYACTSPDFSYECTKFDRKPIASVFTIVVPTILA